MYFDIIYRMFRSYRIVIYPYEFNFRCDTIFISRIPPTCKLYPQSKNNSEYNLILSYEKGYYYYYLSRYKLSFSTKADDIRRALLLFRFSIELDACYHKL